MAVRMPWWLLALLVAIDGVWVLVLTVLWIRLAWSLRALIAMAEANHPEQPLRGGSTD